MKTVERIIGHKMGTGGSSGVSYLKRVLINVSSQSFGMFARNYKNKPVSSLLAGLFLFEHKYVLIKATRYNKLGNDLIGGKVLISSS